MEENLRIVNQVEQRILDLTFKTSKFQEQTDNFELMKQNVFFSHLSETQLEQLYKKSHV